MKWEVISDVCFFFECSKEPWCSIYPLPLPPPPPPPLPLPLPLPPSPPTPLTPAHVLSVHKHKLNLLLMIALLARRGSIHSRRPATTTGEISLGEGEVGWGGRDGEPAGEDRSHIYSGLYNDELSRAAVPGAVQPPIRKNPSI